MKYPPLPSIFTARMTKSTDNYGRFCANFTMNNRDLFFIGDQLQDLKILADFEDGDVVRFESLKDYPWWRLSREGR